MNTIIKSPNIFIVSHHQLWLSGLEALFLSKTHPFNIVAYERFWEDTYAKIHALSADLNVLILQGLDSEFSFLEDLQAYTTLNIIMVTDTQDQETIDQWVLLGVRGVLGPDTTGDQFQKAILKVSEGELWLDRFTTSRIVSEISLKKRIPNQLDKEKYAVELLTDREKGILQAIVSGEGLALKDIATTLYISEFTLRNHLTAIYSKLGVKNRLGLYVFAKTYFARRAGE